MKTEDRNFVVNSYLKSYRNSPDAQHVVGDFYFTGQTRILEKLLQTAEVVVACNPDKEDDIYGYAIVEGSKSRPVVHYVYIKQAFRRQKLAQRILHACFNQFNVQATIITHKPKYYRELSRKFKLIYDPYVIKG